jgi:hypothetical protein
MWNGSELQMFWHIFEGKQMMLNVFITCISIRYVTQSQYL